MGKKGVVFLASYYEALKQLADNDRLQVYDAILSYGIEKIPPTLPQHLQGYFLLMKPNIDASNSRYEAAIVNGQKGGRPPKEPEQNQNINQRENQNINQDKDKEKEKDSETDYEREGEFQEGADFNNRRNSAIKMLDEIERKQRWGVPT